MSEFIESSPVARRRMWLALAALFVLAVVAHVVLLPALLSRIEALPICERIRWLQWTLLACLATLPLFGLWAVIYARRLLAAGQFPPPGAWVLRRTPVRRGAWVRRMGFGLFVCAGLCVALPVAAVWALGEAGLLSTPSHCTAQPST